VTDLSYLLLESAITILFFVACYHSWRRGRGALLELISALVYGLVLEEGDILIFQTYHYSPQFILTVDRVPVGIAMSWAIIIYAGMVLTDAYGLSQRIAPFADALWAIALDLAFDAVAIRLGLWTWVIPLDTGYFGVPAGNFYAWILVAFSFSAFTRICRLLARRRATSRPPWQLATPIAAYAGLLLGMMPFIALKSAFFPENGGGLPIVWIVLAGFILVVGQEVYQNRVHVKPDFDWLPPLLRLSFHLYFLGALLMTRMFLTVPALLAVSLAMLGIEILLVAPLYRRAILATDSAR